MVVLANPSLTPNTARPAWLLWLPVIVGLAVLYLPVYWYLAQHTWSQDEQAHGPFVLAVSAYIAWRLRTDMSLSDADPAPLAGWPILIFGILLYALGISQEVVIFMTASQIPVLLGTLLITQGWRAARTLWFPLLFLVFMVPLPGFFVDAVTAPLKQHVSGIAEDALYAFGYPIARTGVTLVIGPYHLLVADACSGLHSMFSLSALGLFYIYQMNHRGWLRNGILLGSVLPIAFAANIVRVIILVLVTYYIGDEAAQGLFHKSASIVLFMAALMLLYGLDKALGLIPAWRESAQEASSRQ